MLAFVQAALSLLSTLYVFVIATALGGFDGTDSSLDSSLDGPALATEATVLACVQLAGVVALVGGGVLALARRTRLAWLALTTALGAQLVLCLYWYVRLSMVAEDLPTASGLRGAGGFFSVFFAVMPVVGLALVLIGPGRRWFRSAAVPDDTPPPPAGFPPPPSYP